MSEKRNTKLETSDWIAAIAIIVSVVSIIITLGINNKTNDLTEKVNSMEYQMTENLKYELLKMVTDIKSIESKIAVAPFVAEEVDFSQEIEAISNLRTSPGYMLILHSLESEEDRYEVDLNMILLINSIHTTDNYKIRIYIHNILNILRDKTNLDSFKKIDASELVKEFCDMKIIAPEYEPIRLEKDVIFEGFIYHLVDVEKCKDPDVLLFYAVYSDSLELANKALHVGANAKITDSEIIARYSDEYDDYAIKFKQKVFERFLHYLTEERGINDRDVLLFQSVYCNDTFSMRKAIDWGANPNVTNVEIIERYLDEYDSFYKKEIGNIIIE